MQRQYTASSALLPKSSFCRDSSEDSGLCGGLCRLGPEPMSKTSSILHRCINVLSSLEESLCKDRGQHIKDKKLLLRKGQASQCQREHRVCSLHVLVFLGRSRFFGIYEDSLLSLQEVVLNSNPCTRS